MPPHIDTIVDIGCAAGRNLIPYDGEYKLIGIDLPDRQRLKFLRDFKDFRYIKASVQKLTRMLERGELDLRNAVVHTHSVLVYVPERWQKRFYNACIRAGCRNFHLEEYPQSKISPEEYFKLDQKDFFACQWPQVHITEDQKGWWLPVAWFRFENVAERDLVGFPFWKSGI
jgi:hypothetical protein